MTVTDEVQRSIRAVLERLIEDPAKPFLRVACCLWKQLCIEIVAPARDAASEDAPTTEHLLTADGAWELFLRLGAGNHATLFAAGSGGVVGWPVAPGITLLAELTARPMGGIGRLRLRRAGDEIVALVG